MDTGSLLKLEMHTASRLGFIAFSLTYLLSISF